MRITRAQHPDGRVFRAIGADQYHVTRGAIVAAAPKAATQPAPMASLNDGMSTALARILRPQAATRWMLPQLAAITPQYIEMVLRSALTGNHVQQWELFDLMLDTWPELAACANELTDGVSCLKMIFEPFAEEEEDPTPSAIERCKLTSSALRRMQPDAAADENDLEGTITDIIDGWFRGVTCLEIDWQTVSSAVHGTILAPKSTFWVHPVCFAFDQDGRLGLRMDASGRLSSIATQPSSGPASIVAAFPAHKFLLGIHKAKSGSALGGALLRPLAWWWCAANFSADWLLNLAELFGIPFRWASYDPTCADETVSKICAMLQGMGSRGYGAFPKGTELDFLEAGKQGSDHSPQGELLDRADRYARLLILGQTQSGGKGSAVGGQAFGEVESDVKKKRIEAAGRYACRVLNTQLIPSILTLNYGDADECPKVRLLEDEEGSYEEAQRDALLAKIMPVSKAFMRKKYGMPEPQDEDDATGGAEEMAEGEGRKAKEEKPVQARDLAGLLTIEDDALFARELQALTAGAGSYDPDELRDEVGRWVADPSAGIKTPDEARAMLKEGIDTKDVHGNPVRFDEHILEHWASEGHAQKEQDRRLRRLPDAVKAVETPHEVWQGDKQTIHLRTFIDRRSKQRYAAGFIMESGKARSFFHFERASEIHKLRKGERIYARP